VRPGWPLSGQRFFEAQRRYRLLERFKESRFAEWEYDLEREVESMAAEGHLAKVLASRRAEASA
jgi:hypothetical protein